MLKHLRIQNVILVEDASINFSMGLNILTGETGSGKSAIMHGLSLATGERTGTGIVRKGSDKGIVEAIFDLDDLDLSTLLKEGGIEHESGQDLIIRRELSISGKNRVFINNQAAQLSFLRKIGHFLVQIVSQQANQNLYSIDYQRSIVDLYGDLRPLVKQYKKSHENQEELRKQLEILIKQEAQRLREIDTCQKELEELEEAQIKEGEEEKLFLDYTYLVNAEEIAQKVNEINQSLSGEPQAIVLNLHRQKQALDSLIQYDENLKETAESFQNVLTEIQEIARTLRNYQASIHYDANQLYQVNERLTLLNKLKRKYGPSFEEILAYRENLTDRLDKLHHADLEIEKLKVDLLEAEAYSNELADELTSRRKICAKSLENDLTLQLVDLNMVKAQFEVQITPQKRTGEGDDRIEFFLHPNFGENRIALKHGASGGEISRILLALQTILAKKERPSSLIFDEVDSNIGGETATIIAEKLREISQSHQVICITHFPQVAGQAAHHLQISKEELQGRTVTRIKELDPSGKKRELARMAGKKLDH